MASGETTIPVVESSDTRQPERRRAGLQYALVGLLFSAVAITLVRGWNELSGYEWRIDQRAVVVALGLWVLSTLGAAACWLVVTRAFGLRLPIGPALRVYATSNLGKYLPGKVFHVFARVYMVQRQGVPVGVGTTSTVLDLLLYIAAGLVLSVFALPIALISLGGYQPGVMAGAGVAVLTGFVLLHPRLLNAVVKWIARFVPRLRGLRFDLRYRTILLAFLLYVMQWLLVTAAVYASVRSVSLLSADKAPILGAIFALAYIAGLITPTPAGMGAREAVMIPLFSSFMPLPAAVVATILNRLLQVLAETFSAGLLSLVARR